MAKMPEPADPGAALKGHKPCPICGKPAAPSERPFCSKRCADADLYRWLSGSYAIPGPPLAAEKRASAEPEDD